MNINKLLLSTAIAAALAVPSLAYAQAVTVTANPSGTVAGTTYGTTQNTPGATVVGGVIYVILTDYDTASYTPSITDASGNTYTQIETAAASDNNSHAWLFRAPVTTAAGAAELVTASGTGTWNTITVIYLAPPTGYSFAGVDCHNHASVNTGVLAPSCTATQANDLYVGGAGYAWGSPASGSTLASDDTTSGAYVVYGQPNSSGSHSVGITGIGAPTEMVTAAEKVKANSTPPSQCGSSVTPAVASGKYVLQCQLSANLTINNPTGLAAGGGDSFLFQLQQPATEPGTHYTVTFGTAYNQSGAPNPNALSGLSGSANMVDDIFGVSMPTFTNVWAAQRVEIGAVIPNMGN